MTEYTEEQQKAIDGIERFVERAKDDAEGEYDMSDRERERMSSLYKVAQDAHFQIEGAIKGPFSTHTLAESLAIRAIAGWAHYIDEQNQHREQTEKYQNLLFEAREQREEIYILKSQIAILQDTLNKR